MGPGITAEPHCAEREITGLRFLPTLHPEGKASAFHDPCALAQASRRSRSAARSPGLFPAASAPFRPCGLSLASTRLCRRFPDQRAPVRRPLRPHRSAPTVLVLASASNKLHSEECCFLPSLGSGPGPASLAIPGKPVPVSSRHQPSVRGPSWDHRLSRCPDHTLAGDPACGGETIISSGASCRLRFEDPPVCSDPASWGSPILATPNSTSSPCRRRSEVPFLSCRLILAGLLEERAGCPPIT